VAGKTERLKVQNTTTTSAQVLTEMLCDRCGLTAKHFDREFYEFRSVDFTGGYDSLFGDGANVAIDLCQYCLQSQLGRWLRTSTASQVSERKRYQNASYIESMWAALSGWWVRLHETSDEDFKVFLQPAVKVLAQWGCSPHEVNLLLPDLDRCEEISSMARCELMIRAGRYSHMAEILKRLSLDSPNDAVSWLRRPSSNPACSGQSALQVMLRGGLEDIFEIEGMLQAMIESPSISLTHSPVGH
jgi:hypothetical protein